MQNTPDGDLTAILRRLDTLKRKFFATPAGEKNEYDAAPSFIQDLVDTCLCFSRVIDDFLHVSARFDDVRLLSASVIRTVEECEGFVVTYFHIKRAQGFTQANEDARVQQWHDTWSRFGLDPTEIIDKLKIELHQFSTYILLSALNRDPTTSDATGCFAARNHPSRGAKSVRWSHQPPETVLEEMEVDGTRSPPVFDDIWADLVAIRYMHEREMSMASLNPSRPRNAAAIENKLMQAWRDLCIRAGLAEYAGSTPSLPRNSSELLNTPRRNFSDIVVTINEPSVHSSFRSPDSYHHAHIPIDIAIAPNITDSPATSTPAVSVPAARTFVGLNYEKPAVLGRVSTYDERARRSSHKRYSITSIEGPSSPSDGRSTSASYYSSPAFQPGIYNQDGRGTMMSFNLPSSKFFVASIDLSSSYSRLPALKLLNWSILAAADGWRCFQWEVQNSVEVLRHYLPPREQIMPYTTHETMSNALTVCIFEKCRVEYLAQDYHFDSVIPARYSFVDDISRNGFLEQLRDKKLIDSFNFDLLWTNQHKRVANYGMPRGLSNNERLDIWEDSRYPHRFTLTFFVGCDPIEIALRDIRELPHVDSHQIVSIELGARDLGPQTPAETSSKRLGFLPRRKSTTEKSPARSKFSSGYSSDSKDILSGVNVLNVQFSHRTSRNRPGASAPTADRRRTSISSYGSGDKSHGTTQEAKRFMEVFKSAYEDDLVEHPIPVPDGYLEAPYDNTAPVELPAEHDPVELPAPPANTDHSSSSRKFALPFKKKS